MRNILPMTVLLATLAAVLILPAYASVDPQAREPVPVPPPPARTALDSGGTSHAILTFGPPGGKSVRAVYFPQVPDLESCMSLAVSAAARGRGESSAVCLNESRRVVATYYCEWQRQAPRCKPLPF